MGQIVDTDTAREFMKETLEKVEGPELTRIAAEVGEKAAWFGERLSPAALAGLSEADYVAVLRRIFSVRRAAPGLVAGLGFESLRGWTAALLHGPEPVEVRFQAFVDRLSDVPENTRCDLASELLHWYAPDRHWLWTRWMWDPKTRTGALPLVVSAACDLKGDTPGQTYFKVGRAVAFVHEVADAAGFQTISRGIFGTDVFLSCVYVIYAYTVLKMRMTKEFNQVMPGLPEFSRRILGVHRPEPHRV